MRASPLALTIDATHTSLEQRLRDATGHTDPRGQPRDAYARTDAFLAAASRHLAAIDDVLLPLVRRHLPDGPRRARDYLQGARELEQALALLKGRLYGEAHAVRVPWPTVWSDVRRRLLSHNALEREVMDELIGRLDDDHDDLALRVYRSEVKAPTRPHPFTPHTGVPGTLARRLWALADRFWDTAEGRIIPPPVRPRKHRHDSLMVQYLMGTPHFDDKATVFEHHARR
jgi:hypothetical protein